MPQLILSVSGLRGIVGDGLEPAVVADFASGLGTLLGRGAVVVARDGRPSGEMLAYAAWAGLMAAGCEVIDAGIAATPTCGVLVRELGAAGGLEITASHNPPEWNGLKPFTAQGSVFDEGLGRRLAEIVRERRFAPADYRGVGRLRRCDDPHAPHLARVLAAVDAGAIRGRRFHVVLDANHGSGSILGRRLLEALGCRVTVLGGEPDGRFEHPPEPLAENLGGLCAAVREAGADAGFAQDPDADRLAIVDAAGRYLGEELTLAICVEHVLESRETRVASRETRGRKSGAAPQGATLDSRVSTLDSVVTNCSTSKATEDVARRHGAAFCRSKVGEAHVVAKMLELGAVIGGEGNGGVIDPRVGLVRDSFVGMALVLEAMAGQRRAKLGGRGRSVGELADALPRYEIVKDKTACAPERVAAALAAIERRFSDAAPDRLDGLRLDWPDRWLLVRPSNTEPIVRVIAEAPERAAARELCNAALETIASASR